MLCIELEVDGLRELLLLRVAFYTGVGPCIRFNTVLFLFCVLIRGVLLPGGGGGGTYRYRRSQADSDYHPNPNPKVERWMGRICDRGPEKTVKIFPGFRLFEHRQKKFFSSGPRFSPDLHLKRSP